MLAPESAVQGRPTSSGTEAAGDRDGGSSEACLERLFEEALECGAINANAIAGMRKSMEKKKMSVEQATETLREKITRRKKNTGGGMRPALPRCPRMDPTEQHTSISLRDIAMHVLMRRGMAAFEQALDPAGSCGFVKTVLKNAFGDEWLNGFGTAMRWESDENVRDS